MDQLSSVVYTYIPLSSTQYPRYEAIVHVDDYETYRATKPSYSLSKKNILGAGRKVDFCRTQTCDLQLSVHIAYLQAVVTPQSSTTLHKFLHSLFHSDCISAAIST